MMWVRRFIVTGLFVLASAGSLWSQINNPGGPCGVGEPICNPGGAVGPACTGQGQLDFNGTCTLIWAGH